MVGIKQNSRIARRWVPAGENGRLAVSGPVRKRFRHDTDVLKDSQGTHPFGDKLG